MSLARDKFNIAANPDWITDPVIGTLAALDGTSALINTSAILSVTLSGPVAVSIADPDNDLSQQALLNRVLVPAANGSIESILSTFQAHPGIKSDRWFKYHLYGDNIFYALSAGTAGNSILVKRGLPPVYLLGLITGN